MADVQAQFVKLSIDGAVARLVLNDPDRRNAMSTAMFDALDTAIASVRDRNDVSVLTIRGSGAAFCAGFDLAAAAERPAAFGEFIHRLSSVNRALRRLPQVVIAGVHGAALAGGCALVSACDIVICAQDATLGYPVHRIGASPAVTIPTLQRTVGDGPARDLLMSGRLIDGAEAHRIGLATHVVESADTVESAVDECAKRVAASGMHALRITKAWLNELEGADQDGRFEPCATDSARLAVGEEAETMLRTFWETRTAKRS